MTIITKAFILFLLSQLALTAPSQSIEHRDEKAPYCLCYDGQQLAGKAANKVTKYICNNLIQDGHYANGFGPVPPGEGGTSAACLSPNLYAKYAPTWEGLCKTYGGPAFQGGCFSADGNEHCVGSLSLSDCPP